ncbi:carbohydrate-binding module family 50 protein [Pleurostoma richardsiae]|uniref:Carbohydrate-binding module family 50 protein n=1 Tax=Pleurostoma richardsiae TaxID=41990 RepID=A0AA38RSX6_9PEZI|nr:carbohydrate-binding module family 50 protein [Pleurostoma richardsiae]
MANSPSRLVPFLTALFTNLILSLAQSSTEALYPLNYADTSTLIGASQDCLDSYNANVSCPQAIGSLSNVSAQCDSNVTYYNVGDGSSWPVTYRTDQAIYNYNLTCLKRSDGEYCNIWFQVGANSTATPECDECYLDTIYMQAVSPMDGDPEEMQSMYASVSSSCGYTGPVATATVTSLVVSSPTATLFCSSQYAVQPGDSYLSVSESQQVATHDLVTANSLNYNLTDFPSSGTLCIRNQCSVYIVQANDTCAAIASNSSISLAQLHAWNAQINGVCNNLADLVDQTICVSNPLGDFTVATANTTATGAFTTIAPAPTNIAPDTNVDCGEYYDVIAGDDCGTIELRFSISLKDFLFLNPEVWSNCTNLWADTSYCVAPVGAISTYSGYTTPTSTFSITPESSTPISWYDPFASNGTSEAAVSIPLANNTRTDCWDYTWWNSSKSSVPSCWDVAASNEITGEQFVLWNPSLDANLTVSDNATTTVYDYPCTIAPSLSYCVGLASPTPLVSTTTAPPSPRASGEATNCTDWFVGTLSCASHLALLQIDLATLYNLNPSVKSDCSGYVLGTYYCYSTSADGSVTVSDTGSITPTSSSMPTSTSPGGIVTPTPTQAGMVSNCDVFYLVQSGDGCYDIAADYGISLDDFYTWNPAVGTDCSGLWPNYYVCVGIQSSSSTASSSSAPTSTSITATATASSQPISTDGTCGGTTGMTCAGSQFGNCCSSSGYCGSTSAYCGGGCQTAFGTCDAGSDKISPDGTCGGSQGYTCSGSQFGSCCSSSDYCGSTSDYCGSGCQSSFGTCT